MAEIYNQDGINALVNAGSPIPGQSLTNSPDTPYPWEGPPEFTDFREALNYMAEELLEEDIFVPLQILQRGFQEGKWNPDLMMMLIEPMMYLLMALVEKAGVEFRIYGDEEEDLSPEDEEDVANMKAKNLSKLTQEKIGVPSGALPEEIMEDIEELEIPESLLARPEPQEQPESLLGRPE